MHITVLGSGSGGNSALITYGSTRLLVDAGLSAGQLQLRLEKVGCDPASITAILLTHEHGDHTRGLDILTKRFPIPIYCTAQTRQVVRENFKSTHERVWKLVTRGSSFQLAELTVETVPIPHDAVEPMGFIFKTAHHSLGVLSDLGHVTRQLREKLQGLHTLFIEANYDGTLLQNDTKRPFSTKQRISSQHGHLSNHQVAELISEIAHEGLERIILGHLSSDCNKPEIAIKTIRDQLTGHAFSEIEIHCAQQHEPTARHPVRLRRPAVVVDARLVQAELF